MYQPTPINDKDLRELGAIKVASGADKPTMNMKPKQAKILMNNEQPKPCIRPTNG